MLPCQGPPTVQVTTVQETLPGECNRVDHGKRQDTPRGRCKSQHKNNRADHSKRQDTPRGRCKSQCIWSQHKTKDTSPKRGECQSVYVTSLWSHHKTKDISPKRGECQSVYMTSLWSHHKTKDISPKRGEC
ncbi:unnamed protein product [Meganyctiphanes norvegica]|uniref:Uncharacterized protein n=1 Tax=Meganyctiphanes norvegica TaxID=48144 RepID=A0AAV2RRA6_MEGNR